MPEPLQDRIELSIAAIDELMVLLGSVDAVDDLALPDVQSHVAGCDAGEQGRDRPADDTDVSELALEKSE
ncbi:hypothetical protein [Roseimaritima ulvae]|uniref:Uncharacterized protein n=1 Tax=Roseimaritima ulvae TaxID=980254 RepID=A0A5B9R7Z3_9BACT|nr:hypothetical protein [Roseimaritima ulvae]QEG42643.1 hypothetical protein UC8_46850 [Roseimaritima ulvae]